jgi:hypothetical protein
MYLIVLGFGLPLFVLCPSSVHSAVLCPAGRLGAESPTLTIIGCRFREGRSRDRSSQRARSAKTETKLFNVHRLDPPLCSVGCRAKKRTSLSGKRARCTSSLRTR